MSVLRYTWKQAQAFTTGRPYPIRAILLHSTDGHRDGDIATLTGPKVSVHWYVTKTGDLYHFVDDTNTAWHAGIVDNPKVHGNGATVGIEQEHIDGEEPWPDALVQTTANLVAALRQKHSLKLPVLSHASVATFTMGGHDYGRKVDPTDFPWSKLHTLVAEAMKDTWTFEQEA